MLDENQIIGLVLVILGSLFVTLGIVLLMDTALMAIGNVLFLLGVALCLGFRNIVPFFARKERLAGTLLFFLGIVLVMMRWGLVGIIVELFGFINLFGNFFPVLLFSARQMPYIGPVLRSPIFDKIVAFISDKGGKSEHSKSRV